MIPLEELVPDDRERFRILAAIAAVNASNSGKILLDFLKRVSQHIDRSNRTLEPPRLQWSQGAAQLLEELTTLMHEAGPLASELRAAVEADENPAARLSG